MNYFKAKYLKMQYGECFVVVKLRVRVRVRVRVKVKRRTSKLDPEVGSVMG